MSTPPAASRATELSAAAGRLTRQNFRGAWAGIPVAWGDGFEFDESTYRADVARCCRIGAHGIYTGGTTGEFYAMEFDEFQAVAKATVSVSREHGVPVMIGCTSTYTLGVLRRAAYAAEIGADAIQVALPFWMEIPDKEIVPFFRAVAEVAPKLALSIYETTRAKKCLRTSQHQEIKAAAANYLMVKAMPGTVGCTAEGCAELSKSINVFVSETHWAELGRFGAIGACSSDIYWFPGVINELWRLLEAHEWERLEAECSKVEEFTRHLVETYSPRGFTDSAFDRLGSHLVPVLRTSLRCRGPYPFATKADVDELRRWVEKHFPNWLQPEPLRPQ